MDSKLKINREIAAKFYHKAKALEAKGEPYRFRALSFIKAAQALENLDRGVDEIYLHGWLTGLQKIKGIGQRLARAIEMELNKRGIRK